MPEPINPENVQTGTRIRVRGAPERQGTIVSLPHLVEGRCYVRVDFDQEGRRNTPLDHLELLPSHLDAIAEIGSGRFEPAESLRRNLLHEKLNGKLSDVVYSMDTSNTEFFAYQFKPVLKLLESPTNSLLIADEVGLGKTIEAGLIWTELRAREGARSLLVVCPPHLVTKWRTELRSRFGVDATAAGPEELLEKLTDARANLNAGFAIVASYHSLRPPKNWEEDANSPAARLAQKAFQWGSEADEPLIDLLVMDEAAIMRNEESQTSRLGALLTPLARHKAYLSATPLHTRARNLFTLLRRLDPDTFPDEQTFAGILEANEPLVALRDVILTGQTTIQEVRQRLSTAQRSPLLSKNRSLSDLHDRVASLTELTPRTRIELAHQVERANLLAYVVTRTRRRDVDKHPVIREVNTVRVPLNPEERTVYSRVTAAVWDYAEQEGINTGFLTVMPQRQVASCIPAACQRFLSCQDADGDLSPDFTWDRRRASAGPLTTFIGEQLTGTVAIDALMANDSKYEKLVEALSLHWQYHPKSKLVLFAYFKPTLYYLKERLTKAGTTTLLLTGDETRDKQEIVDEFRERKDVQILLSSEVGSEGLDLQFASAIVNYDLPWNPMVVEQRIGRIHRIGQKADQIVVINLICEDTVDERIYDRLYDRLDLFRRTLGDLEAVIGPVVNDLTKDLLSLRLSERNQIERITSAANAIEEQMRLEEQLESEASVLAAYGDYIINQISAAHERGDWINASDLQAFVLAFFRRSFPATQISGIDQNDRDFEIELDAQAGFAMDEFLRRSGLRGQTRIASGERRKIRFDHRVFTGAPAGMEIVHQSHPLIRFISDYARVNRLVQPVAVGVQLEAKHRPKNIMPGIYAFVSQRWSVDGLRSYERLYHEVVSIETGERIEEPAAAATLVEVGAALGHPCDDVPQEGDELLSILSERAADLEMHSVAAFQRFLDGCERENSDRKDIQLRGVNRFEERRSAILAEVHARHAAAGRANLVAATEGQVESLKRKSSAQRLKIESKNTTGNSKTIAAGFILVE
jgi:superfamily II DNA or RNA helicase